jgi:hypothetical protein
MEHSCQIVSSWPSFEAPGDALLRTKVMDWDRSSRFGIPGAAGSDGAEPETEQGSRFFAHAQLLHVCADRESGQVLG